MTHYYKTLLGIVICGISFLSPAMEAKNAKIPMTVQDTWSVPGIIGTGVKANDAYVDGSFFITVPAWSSIGRDGWLEGDVIFLEPYTSWGEQGEVVASLGLGWRHLFSQQGVGAVLQHDGHQANLIEEGAFVGANLFVDMLDTQFDNRFWQLGFGLEAGTRYLEARANYYLPLSDRQVAEEIRTRQSVQQRSTLTEYDDPFATGHTIQQDVTVSSLLTTTTIERLFRRYEDGMEGWDAEVALLLPWVDRWMDVKLIGGYYAFDNQPFGPQAGGTGNVEGWKAGIEVRPVPAVALHATWYEDERFVGSDWLVGVRLEIPFEAGDLGDGKGLWGRVADAFRPRRRHLAERMAEPVRRQNAAIKIANSVEEDKSEAEVKVVTKVISQSKSRVVLEDTVVFVDNAIGSATNPGTYEEPLDTITNGMSLGNSSYGNSAVVFVQGRPQAYGESVLISSGVRLFGSGNFPALGGEVFHGRTRLMPLVNGGFYAKDIASTVQITGFDIRGGLASGFPDLGPGVIVEGSGIAFENVAYGIATRNVIRPYYTGKGNNAFGIAVRTSQGASHYLLDQNVIIGGGTGIYVWGEGQSRVSAELTGNFVTDSRSGSGITMQVLGNSVGQFVADSNIVMNSVWGMTAYTGDNARGTFTFSNNEVSSNAMGGMELLSYDSSRASYELISNTVTGSFIHGMFLMAADPGTRVTAFLSDNHIMFNTGPQIEVRNLGGVLTLFSEGALSNDVRESLGNAGDLYHVIQGPIGGAILLNGTLQPANVSRP